NINQLVETAVVSRDDVVRAAARIAGLVECTPLLESEVQGTRVWLKCECLQTGGAFKLRGATNRLLQLTPGQRERGVVAFSSGNHAQGVAIAAKRIGISATIVMPSDAPEMKVKGTRDAGAEIVFYNRRTESREDIGTRLAQERGASLVHPFGDPAVIAGQGTVGLEILEQLMELDEGAPERIIVPTGGGGLTSGIVLACSQANIVRVDPEGWDDMRRSLELGQIVPVAPDAPATLCDALQTPQPSPITFGILRDRGAKVVTVSDAEVAEAVRFA